MKTKKSTEPKLRYKNYVMFVSDCCKDRFDLYEEFTREKTGEKAKKVIGWQPKTSPEAGVKLLYDWVKDNKEMFKGL
jgi:nucleoside-diphosphate-sugar epimerase